MSTVQNNGRSTGGITGKGFLPGKTGNPGGRPKGLAALAREGTDDGKLLVEQMVKIVMGQTINRIKPKISDVINAVEWLADRGFGKTANIHELTSKDGGSIQVEHMSAEQIRQSLIDEGFMDANGRIKFES
jgi:hypothetical protein